MSEFIYDPCPHCREPVAAVRASLSTKTWFAVELEPCGHTVYEISIRAWPVIDEHGNEFPDPPYQVSYAQKPYEEAR